MITYEYADFELFDKILYYKIEFILVDCFYEDVECLSFHLN
jgi:hypothetical protein